MSEYGRRSESRLNFQRSSGGRFNLGSRSCNMRSATFWNRSRSLSKRNRPRLCQPSNRETNFHLSSRWIRGGSGRSVIGRTFRIHSPYSFPTDSSTAVRSSCKFASHLPISTASASSPASVPAAHSGAADKSRSSRFRMGIVPPQRSASFLARSAS